MIARVGYMFLVALALLATSGCGGRMPDGLGVTEGLLQPCPKSPNCVSSLSKDEEHGIVALKINGSPETAWRALEAELESRPRVDLEERSEGYLHAVFTSKLMRYRDDVEFYLNASAGEIEVRSASRVGYGDMGVNRRRIESIRTALALRGVVHVAKDA